MNTSELKIEVKMQSKMNAFLVTFCTVRKSLKNRGVVCCLLHLWSKKLDHFRKKKRHVAAVIKKTRKTKMF